MIYTLIVTALLTMIHQSPDSVKVRAIIEQFHHALETGDSSAALALLHPDVIVMEAGGVENVAEYRSHHLADDIEFSRAVPTERGVLHWSINGDMAWTWSTSSTKGSFRGRPIDSVGAEMVTLLRTRNGWRITGIHWSSRRRANG